MKKARERFRRGKGYTIREGGFTTKITYCDRFKGPKRSEAYQETFLVFRLEPERFPRIRGKKSK